MNLNLPAGKLIDISLPLDARTFHMRTYSGFKKDMQFDVEVIKEYEDGGYGQIVRGAHMRLHAGTHVDAPSHMLKGAPDLQDVPLRATLVMRSSPTSATAAAEKRSPRPTSKRLWATSSCQATVSCCGPTKTKTTTVRRRG